MTVESRLCLCQFSLNVKRVEVAHHQLSREKDAKAAAADDSIKARWHQRFLKG